ncbi:MAG TPA: hypothetical protein VH916_07790, partial [Dehalococcoidia bacterium]
VAPSGELFVSYYDRRYGCETFGCQDYTASSSTNGGTSWRDRRVTTSSMQGPEANSVEAGFLGDYTSNAADGNGAVLVWADTRGLYGQNEQDIYYAQLGASAGGGPRSPGPPSADTSDGDLGD